METNTFLTFLKLLKVKHTKQFSGKFYNEHPYKYNLLGLSKMLSDYGIENAGIKLNNQKEKLNSLEPPFIAYAGNDFVVVDKLTKDNIRYIWRNKSIQTPIDKFNEIWTGIVLLAQADKNSIEPNYKENKKKELYGKIEKCLLLCSACTIIVLLFIAQQLSVNGGAILLFLINLTGIYIGYLLVLKQMHTGSNYIDKICSLFKQNDCNSILCLIVQVLLWSVFFVNLFAGYIQIPSFTISDLLWIGCIYLGPLLAINLLTPALSKGNRMEYVTQIINSMKADEHIFLTFLKKQPRHDTGKEHSTVLWGNSESKTWITILTNPHCNPCCLMHNRIEKLLKNSGNKFCVQYIFTSFSEELESSSRFLIDIYQRYSEEKALTIYNEWFNEGKSEKEVLFEKYNFDMHQTVPEYFLHQKWQEQQQLTATPTILINGYELPENYKIEDLMYFTDLDIDSK